MSATGLEVFDRTLEKTNIWLGELMEALDVDRQTAWKVLSTVLHKIRDRIPVGLSAHLGAQLPLLVRGVYYDMYEPGRQPVECDGEEFIAEVDEWLADAPDIDAARAISAVVEVLNRHIDPGQAENVRHALPEGVRELWAQPESA